MSLVEMLILLSSKNDQENPIIEHVKEVVGKILQDSSFPVFKTTKQDISDLRDLLTMIRLRSRFEHGLNTEVLLTSLNRFKEETGCDLLAHPMFTGQTDVGATPFLAIRDTLGLIALVWQIHHHPNDIRLTGGSYKSPSPLH